MLDDKQKSQSTPQRGKDVDDPNNEERDVIDIDDIDDEDLDDEDFDDDDLDDDDLDDDDLDDDDDGAMNVARPDEDPAVREAELGNRITRDDGDNDDLGALK